MHGHLTGLAVVLYFAPVCSGWPLALAAGGYWLGVSVMLASACLKRRSVWP